VVGAVATNLVGAFMLSNGVPQDMVVTNYGFLLGPVVGFVLDMAYNKGPPGTPCSGKDEECFTASTPAPKPEPECCAGGGFRVTSTPGEARRSEEAF
jgi:hypothetical protein